MARSGSGSRTSRGVNSWSAAVRTPTFMNFGSNALVVIGGVVLIVDFDPGTTFRGALQNRFDDAVGAVAVFERSERGRMGIRGLPSVGDEAVNVAHHVGERVGPRLLVSARKMCVAAGFAIDQRR